MNRSARPRLSLALATILWVTGAGWSAPDALAQNDRSRAGASEVAAAPALHLRSGAVARNQVVGLGRDVLIEGDAGSDVVAVAGSVTVAGSVEGDVIALGGDVRLEPTARIRGEVFALGGVIEAAPGADLGGRMVSYPSVAASFLALVAEPALGLPPLSPPVLLAKLSLLTAWLLLVLLCFAASAPQVLATAQSVRVEPLRNVWVGLTGIASFVLTGLFVSAFAGPVAGLPLLALVVLALLLLKLWGMVAVFYAVGDALCRRLPRKGGRRVATLTAATVGLAALGVIKLVPYLGTWVWTIASLVAVGAALSTKLGRREPWFELDPAPASSRS